MTFRAGIYCACIQSKTNLIRKFQEKTVYQVLSQLGGKEVLFNCWNNSSNAQENFTIIEIFIWVQACHISQLKDNLIACNTSSDFSVIYSQTVFSIRSLQQQFPDIGCSCLNSMSASLPLLASGGQISLLEWWCLSIHNSITLPPHMTTC